MPKTNPQAPEVQIPMHTRDAAVMPATIDAEKRTVEVCWSTGAKVRRYSWYRDEWYDEELSLDPAHVDLSRLNNGAPFLNTHNSYELSDVIGVVLPGSARIDKGAAYATIQFSARDDVTPIWKDVEGGIIRNISCGYNTRKYVIEQEEGQVPVYRAIEWQPMELSAVPMGADDGAKFRGKPTGLTHPCTIEIRANAAHNVDGEENPMSNTTTTAAGLQAAATPAVPGVTETRAPAAPPAGTAENQAALEAARAAATTAERTRVSEIRGAVRTAKLSDDIADKLIADGVSVDLARKAILEEMARASSAIDIRGQHVQVGADQLTAHRAAVENAVLHRYDPTTYKLTDHGREYRGMSLLEIGRTLLELRGLKVRGLSKMELAGMVLGLETRDGALHSVSDFPNILANVANKTLRAAYDAAPQTFRPFTKQGSAPDFKTITRTQFGDAPSLLPLNEQGGYQRGTISDGKETYALATYGRVVGVTRQVLINDDLGAFTRIPALFGQAGADLLSDTVWGIIIANANMADGFALFQAANHLNLTASGTAISVAALGVARAAMRKQVNLAGRPINVQPKYLIVPSAKETEAQQFVVNTNIVYTKGADYNPFAGALQVLAEPRLDVNSAVSWYMSADPAQIDTIEYSFLEGNEGPTLATRIGFDVDGVEIKASMDVAAKALDWRGLYKNNGA